MRVFMMQKQIVPGRIIEFDATALRRQAMRNRSAGEIGIMPTSPLADDVVSDSGSSSVTLTSSTDQETSVGVNRSEMQSFLINFVIEQTGYPEEIVELDADLEGDLGIDSIKKAQLFGEIGEQYKVQARENLSFDDFPTLRHVLDFLCVNVT